jgi:hypothetical protein
MALTAHHPDKWSALSLRMLLCGDVLRAALLRAVELNLFTVIEKYASVFCVLLLF